MRRHTLDEVLRAGLAHRGAHQEAQQAQPTDAPPRPVRPQQKMRALGGERKQGLVNDAKGRRAEVMDQNRQDEMDANAVLRTLQAIDLYAMDLPDKPELAILVAWMAVGRVLVQFGYVNADLVDDFTQEVEVAMFYAEVEGLPEELDLPPVGSTPTVAPTDAPMTDYEFSLISDVKDAGASIAHGVKRFVEKTFGFNTGARAARSSGGKPKGIWAKIKPWVVALADNLPNLLLFLSIRQLDGIDAENATLVSSDGVAEALARDERVKGTLNWAGDIVRTLGNTLSGGMIAPPSTDLDRNAQKAESLSNLMTRFTEVFGAVRAGPNGGGAEMLKNLEDLMNVRLPKARDLVKVSKKVAGQARPTQMAVVIWAVIFFLLQRLMNHSRRRLQAFIRANDVGVQKHAIVVWRKYIDAKEFMFAGASYPNANRVTDEELEKLSFVGTKWNSIPEADKRALQFEDLWLVAKQTYAMWGKAHRKLNAATKNKAAKIFKGDYRGAMNGTLGVTFKVVNRFMVNLPFARDYVSVASQAISVVTYLYWRYTTAELVKQLQAAVLSALSVKQLLGANVTAQKISTYERTKGVEWTLDADWEAEPVKKSAETIVANDFNCSEIDNRRRGDDYKILMKNVRCKDDEDEEDEED